MRSKYTTEITARAWSEPNVGTGNPDNPERDRATLENPFFAVDVEWTWPTEDAWTRFQIIRSIRSPASRLEEGVRLVPTLEGMRRDQWGTTNPDTGNPMLRDPQPPPGEWVFYNLFVLDHNRVWNHAGHALEIGPRDHDWAYRLPATLPGVSVSRAQGVIHYPDQDHDLVQFLQVPGAEFDIAATMADALLSLWDPLKAPPQLLPSLCRSWGYPWTDSIGLQQSREILAALSGQTHGSLDSVRRIAAGAYGGLVLADMSHNWMLDVADSSFEVLDRDDFVFQTRWNMLSSDFDPGTGNLELIGYTDITTPPPVLAPNLLVGNYLYVKGSARYECGHLPVLDTIDGEVLVVDRELKPIRAGIPISDWTRVRMGCYATSATATEATLQMGVDIYDYDEQYLGSLEMFDPPATVGYNNWAAYFQDTAINIATIWDTQYAPGDAVTNPARWTPLGSPFAQPQTAPTAQSPGGADPDFMEFVPGDGSVLDAAQAYFSLEPGTALEPGKMYTLTLDLHVPTDSGLTARPATVEDGLMMSAGPSVFYREVYDEDDKYLSVSLDFEALDPTDFPTFSVGLLVERAGSWSGTDAVQVAGASIKEQAREHAYAVPWFEVSDACYIDLIVTDDG